MTIPFRTGATQPLQKLLAGQADEGRASPSQALPPLNSLRAACVCKQTPWAEACGAQPPPGDRPVFSTFCCFTEEINPKEPNYSKAHEASHLKASVTS